MTNPSSASSTDTTRVHGIDDDHDVDRVHEVDVVVVGAGPGGGVLADLLARSGVSVALLERGATFEREFRGFAFQPSAVRILDEMDLLDAVRDLSHEELDSLSVDAYGRHYDVTEFDGLPGEYDFGLLLEQPHLLEVLFDSAASHGTDCRLATTVVDLLGDESEVRGVVAHDRGANETVAYRARVVVGADGRYSTVRDAVGIDAGLFDSHLDVLWFKLNADVAHDSIATITEHGIVLGIRLGEQLQVGYVLERGGYDDLKSAGIDDFRARVAAIDPQLRVALERDLTDFGDCSLLHIGPGLAPEWTRDGLVLLGDAAHVASPVGGQGNALAMQDAAALHGVLCRVLRDDDGGDGSDGDDTGPLPASAFQPYVDRRRPAVKTILRFQRRAERLLTWLVHNRDDIPVPLQRLGARLLFSLATTSPVSNSLRETVALGPDPVAVEQWLFGE
ncbi:FAD-dependent monooxygenase [Haloarchaeobius sp. DFWS5]|uniref:FAD-dependent monooxygenase n=1 Tax=Haloarchaeobius sp. DFWS5 TaxID=3446114 RepID=UPI003EB7F9DA